MLERILAFSIHHRVLILLLTIVAAAVGAYSLQHLPIDAVPDITNNQVQINTLYPSFSPEEIEKQITLPIETALAGIPGLELTRSISRNGFSQVQAVFADDVDIYFARQQVAEHLLTASELLPDGAEPKMGPISTGLGEVYQWTVHYAHPRGEGADVVDGRPGWQSDGSYLTPEGRRLTTELERAAYLREVQDWIIRPQVQSVKDVAGVDAIGGYVKQYQVQPDPMKLVSYALTFQDLIDALRKNNVSAGAGYIEHKGESYLVRFTGRVENEREIAEIVVATRNGTAIRIGDVATVAIGGELRTGSASENGSEVVIGTALMLIGANSRTVAAAVDAEMSKINHTLPADIRAKTVLNRTKLVDATIRTVRNNLVEGAILVVVVLFVLLGDLRAAFITALAIPLSMLITAAGMVQTKVSGNLMSLGAIDFGLIVDGSVIIVENCLRMLAEKQHSLGRQLTLPERLETVFEASKQVRSATAFGEAIIITVYLPILTLTGVEGKMFRPMALTVVFALSAAFVLSLTFVPAMVSLLIRRRVNEKENVAVRLAKRAYQPLLAWAVRHRWAVVCCALAAFAASLILFAKLGREFVPTLDEQDIAIEGLRIASTSLTQSTQMQLEVEKTIAQFPEVEFVFSKSGTAEMATDPVGPNSSDTFIVLKPREQWPDPTEPKAQLIERLEEALSDLPGNLYEFTQPIQMRFNELIAGVRSDVAVKVFGEDPQQLMLVARQIAGTLASVDGAEGVKVEQTIGQPVMTIRADENTIGRYGLSKADVEAIIVSAVGGAPAGQVLQGDRRFELVVRLPESLRKDIHALEDLPVPLPQPESTAEPTQFALLGRSKTAGQPGFVPLSSVLEGGHIKVAEGANQISRENGRRRVVIQCNVRGRDLGSFVTEAQQRIEDRVELPPGVRLQWGGQFENLINAQQRLSVVVPVCFLLIFALLYATFGSAKHAGLVFTGVPLALTGGIVALWLSEMPFSISAAVGFIALSGVAVLNGLVMITFINQLASNGLPVGEAIVQGSLTRLRPVLMTALVASLGFVPMALATGPGAEVQKPLATVVIGGIVSSTLLTLFVLPALYRLVHREGPSVANLGG
ncbi:MAG: CusA/CzcA family heavy metal efflux RND transporter [Planctomycetes bacterium]|nr:CusA/CzcA family heavy metal efflux RND transporter [Planctomycetota bacterium]